MVLFGLSWAKHRVSRPIYEGVASLRRRQRRFPSGILGRFQEGILEVWKGRQLRGQKGKLFL